MQYLRDVKRDRKILLAAQRLFHERGFDAVGIDEGGVRPAGITGPAITGTSTARTSSWDALRGGGERAARSRGRPQFDDP